MLTGVTALEEVEDILTSPAGNSNNDSDPVNAKKIAELSSLFESGVSFDSREEAETIISALATIAVKDKNATVRETAFLAMGRLMEEERKEGFGNKPGDWLNAKIALRDYDESPYRAAEKELAHRGHKRVESSDYTLRKFFEDVRNKDTVSDSMKDMMDRISGDEPSPDNPKTFVPHLALAGKTDG